MPAARYWRTIGLQSVGGGALELSALHLYLSGVRVDATATLTSTIAPTSGTLANLQDDDTATVCRFADATAPGFALVWDFGSGNTQDVDALRLGSGALQNEFLESATLQYSSTGAVWKSISTPLAGWPGANAMQAVPAFGDPDYDSVSLLLHCDGANGSTTFVDSSPSPKTVTAVGNAKISTAQSAFGGASLLLDGDGDYLSFPASADAGFGAGDWTVEGQFFPTVSQSGNRFLLDMRAVAGASLVVWCSQSSVSNRIGYSTEAGTNFVGGGTWVVGAWNHWAMTRASGSVRGFINGVLVFTTTDSRTYAASQGGFVGSSTAGGQGAVGYVDEVRITKGVARYTANFTPPTAAFADSSGGGVIPVAPRLRPSATPTAIALSGGASAPAGPVLSPAAVQIDRQDFGLYRITNFVEQQGTPNTPLRRRVQLWNQRDARMVRETWSDATTGAYTFNNIRGGDGTRYCAVAYDHTGNYQGVIADNLEPEAMP